MRCPNLFSIAPGRVSIEYTRPDCIPSWPMYVEFKIPHIYCFSNNSIVLRLTARTLKLPVPRLPMMDPIRGTVFQSKRELRASHSTHVCVHVVILNPVILKPIRYSGKIEGYNLASQAITRTLAALGTIYCNEVKGTIFE